MYVTYEFYLNSARSEMRPAWVKSERYFNCEHFSRFLRMFRK